MKKLVALLLALVMVMSLAACSKSGNDSTEAGSKQTQAAANDKTDAATDEVIKSDVPELLGPGNVTLKRLSYNVAWDPNEDIIAGIIEEVTGYEVEYYMLPAENADEKLVLEVGGGTDHDLITVSVNQWRTLLSMGALMPLDDLLEAYGPNILAANTETVWDAMRGDDGKIYGMAYMYPHSYEIATYMQCRLDLMAEAGITEVPTTIDEFYDCLVALKNHFGDQYIIFTGPYRPASEGSENWVIPKTIACAFGIYNDWMVDEDGNVYYMTEAEGFEDMINFFAKLYAEGLIDPDWAVNTDTSIREKFASGQAIISASNRSMSSKCSEALIENVGITWDDIGYISALEGENGLCTYMSTEAFNQVSCIPANCDVAADVINWIDLKVQEQLYINIGVEGVHFNYDEEGGIDPINPIFAEERGNSYWYLDTTDAEAFQKQWPSRVRKSAGQWHAFSAVTMNETRDIFVPNTFAFMPATENYATYNVTLMNYLMDFITQVMSGTRTMADIGSLQSDLNNNYLEDVRAELQTWYNDFYK